jgi:hypothetical protein
MPADKFPPNSAVESPRPVTAKRRSPGAVQTVSNNTSALTLGDLARGASHEGAGELSLRRARP